MFAAIGRFACRFRWAVIAVWLVLLVAGLVSTPYLGGVLQGGGFSDSRSPSEVAAAVIQQRLPQGLTNVVVVFSSNAIDARSSEFVAEQEEALARLTAAGIPHLESVQTYSSTGSTQLLSRDGKSSVAVLTFDAPSRIVQEEVEAIRAALGTGTLRTYVTGEAAVDADLSTESMRDLRKVELYALPVALIALLVVFGTLVAAALPVITGVLAVSATLGVLYLLGRVTDMSIFSMNTATLLGLAVAIDYALFIVARFREELDSGASVNQAVITSTARAGRSVFFSGIAVVVGVLGLTFFPFSAVRSLGIGGALVVFFSVAASLTFMPALLSVIGTKVNAVRVVPHRPTDKSRFWRGYTAFLVKRPWLFATASLVLVLIIAFPAFGMRTEMPSATSLPGSTESRQGYDILDRDFDRSALSPISVLVTWEGGGETVDMDTALPLYTFGQQLAKTPGVASVISIFNLPGLEDVQKLAGMWQQFQSLLAGGGLAAIPAGRGLQLPSGETISAAQLGQIQQLIASSMGRRAVLFRVVSEAPPSSTKAQDLAGAIAESRMPQGFSVYVAGEAAGQRDFFQGLNGRFPWVVLWIAVASYVMLLFLLRSLVLPLVAVGVNALTMLMSYGCIVFIFQGGRFAGLLGYTPTGATDAIIFVVLLCALFGITMDYAVFLLTRMQEQWVQTHDNRASVGRGLIQSGRIVLSAALLVVVVTGAFAFTGISITQMLGLGIALAIVADALLIRLALLPASMCYLGSTNWWLPGWLLRAVGAGGKGIRPARSSGTRPRPRVKRGSTLPSARGPSRR